MLFFAVTYFYIYTSFPGGAADDGNADIKARAKYASIFCRAEAVKSHPCGGLIYHLLSLLRPYYSQR